MAVNIIEQYCYNNDCYRSGAKVNALKYLVVHAPAVIKISWDKVEKDAIISGNEWYRRWNKSGLAKLAHGVIDTDGVHKFLPDDRLGWHCANYNMHTMSLGYEFCEYNDADKFDKVYNNGVEYYAYLCKKYNIPVENILGHQEAYKRGLASNHGDPDKYFAHFGKSMKTFRNDVQATLAGIRVNLSEKKEEKVKEDKDMANMMENIYATDVFNWKPVVRVVAKDGVEVYDRPITDENKVKIDTLNTGNKIRVLAKLNGGKGGCGIVAIDRKRGMVVGYLDCYYLKK